MDSKRIYNKCAMWRVNSGLADKPGGSCHPELQPE